MFRGGSYLDQPKFSDFNVPLRNSLDISDIKGAQPKSNSIMLKGLGQLSPQRLEYSKQMIDNTKAEYNTTSGEYGNVYTVLNDNQGYAPQIRSIKQTNFKSTLDTNDIAGAQPRSYGNTVPVNSIAGMKTGQPTKYKNQSMAFAHLSGDFSRDRLRGTRKDAIQQIQKPEQVTNNLASNQGIQEYIAPKEYHATNDQNDMMGKSAVEMSDEEYRKFYLDELDRLNATQKPTSGCSGLGASASQPDLGYMRGPLSPGGKSNLANHAAAGIFQTQNWGPLRPTKMQELEKFERAWHKPMTKYNDEDTASHASFITGMRPAGVNGGPLSTKRVNLDLGKSRLFGIPDDRRPHAIDEPYDQDGIMKVSGKKHTLNKIRAGNGQIIAVNYGAEKLSNKDFQVKPYSKNFGILSSGMRSNAGSDAGSGHGGLFGNSGGAYPDRYTDPQKIVAPMEDFNDRANP